jgi:hypothetical protein
MAGGLVQTLLKFMPHGPSARTDSGWTMMNGLDVPGEHPLEVRRCENSVQPLTVPTNDVDHAPR